MESSFKFSTTVALREAWVLFKKHFTFFLGIALITILLNIAGNGRHIPGLLVLLIGIVSFVWSIVWLRISLVAARGDESKLSFGSIQGMLPTVRDALSIIAIEILAGLLLGIGGVLLFGSFLFGIFTGAVAGAGTMAILGVCIVAVGVYISFRFVFAIYTYLDKKTSIRESLRISWRITRGHFWKMFGTLLVAAGICLAGFILFGVGILVAYPLASILVAKLYLAISGQTHTAAPEAVVVAPDEVLPAQETTPSE